MISLGDPPKGAEVLKRFMLEDLIALQKETTSVAELTDHFVQMQRRGLDEHAERLEQLVKRHLSRLDSLVCSFQDIQSPWPGHDEPTSAEHTSPEGVVSKADLSPKTGIHIVVAPTEEATDCEWSLGTFAEPFGMEPKPTSDNLPRKSAIRTQSTSNPNIDLSNIIPSRKSSTSPRSGRQTRSVMGIDYYDYNSGWIPTARLGVSQRTSFRMSVVDMARRSRVSGVSTVLSRTSGARSASPTSAATTRSRLDPSLYLEDDTPEYYIRGESQSSEKDLYQENSTRVREVYEGYMTFLSVKNSKNFFTRFFPSVVAENCFTEVELVRCRWAENLAESGWFQLFIVALILCDAFYVAFVTDQNIRISVETYDRGEKFGTARSDWMLGFDTAMNVCFAAEVLVRMVAQQGRFCVGEGNKWNLFDFSMVVVSLTELMYLYSGGGVPQYAAVLRLLRVVRSLRLLRLLQMLPMLDNMQLMVLAFWSSALALFAAMCLLLLVILMFAIIFDNAVANYINNASLDNGYVDRLKTYFGSLSQTLLTLFMAMSGGIDWWEVVQLLLEIHVVYTLLFVLFVCLTVIAALNIITGVFVNEGLAMARMDEDLRHQMDMRESRALASRLHNLFQTIVCGSSTAISLEELKLALQREDVSTLFSVLGIEITDPQSFFGLLDQDRSGYVEIDEFVVVCLRLRGRSGMMNMEISVQEISGQIKKIMTQSRSVSHQVDRIERRMLKVHRILKHVHEDDTPVGTPTGRETGSIASLLEGAVDSGSEEAKSEASAVSLELTQKPSTPPTKPS